MVERALDITNLQLRSGCDIAAERIDASDLTIEEAQHLCSMLEERMATIENARSDPLFREYVASEWDSYFRASVGVQEIYRQLLEESRLDLAPNPLERERARWKLMGQAIFLTSFFSQLKTHIENEFKRAGTLDCSAIVWREPLRSLFP